MLIRSKSKTTTPSSFRFKAKLWKSKGPVGWFLLTIPKTTSSKIRKAHASSEEGWGRLRATAGIGASRWKTSIWFDTKSGAYLLPVRSAIRKKKKIEIGTLVSCSIKLESNDWTLNNVTESLFGVS